MKGLHQTALDEGNWRVGRSLTGLPDPISRRVFGGTEAEMEVAANYLKAIDELTKRVRPGGGSSVVKGEDEEEKPEWVRKPKGKGKGRKRLPSEDR